MCLFGCQNYGTLGYKKKVLLWQTTPFYMTLSTLFFVAGFRGHRYFFSAFRSSGCQHFSSVNGSHALPETVFVSSFSF